MKNFYVEIIHKGTGKTEKRMGPFSEHNADKCERGASRNLDHERYYTWVDEVEEE